MSAINGVLQRNKVLIALVSGQTSSNRLTPGSITHSTTQLPMLLRRFVSSIGNSHNSKASLSFTPVNYSASDVSRQRGRGTWKCGESNGETCIQRDRNKDKHQDKIGEKESKQTQKAPKVTKVNPKRNRLKHQST